MIFFSSYKSQVSRVLQLWLLNRNLTTTEERTESCRRHQASTTQSSTDPGEQEDLPDTAVPMQGVCVGRKLAVKVAAIIKKMDFFVSLFSDFCVPQLYKVDLIISLLVADLTT